MEDIASEIANILDTYYHKETGIICDNGFGNVITVDGQQLQYDFIDSDENRSQIEEEKIKFLNETMELFLNIQRHIALYSEEYGECSTELDKRLNQENVGEIEDTMEEMKIE